MIFLNGAGQLLRASEITFAYATGWPPTTVHQRATLHRFTPGLKVSPTPPLGVQLKLITRMSDSGLTKSISPRVCTFAFANLKKRYTDPRRNTRLPVTMETDGTRQQANDLQSI